MNFHVMTLFPEMIENAMGHSIIGRAMKAGYVSLEAVNIRDFADNKHNRVDDYPYGGGAGMVMQAEPVYRCYEDIINRMECPESSFPRVIYLTPQGRVFDQDMAREYAGEEELIFLCGHYEGVDERVLNRIVTDYVSIGDYVLTGGELPALVMMDTISRLIPGVLNNDDSAETESFADSLLEYPQYTRPAVWQGEEVPSVLLSGHHKNLQEWYRRQSVIRTAQRRPDLLKKADLTPEEQELVQEIIEGMTDKQTTRVE
ncbi:MAG: tRNA (guanosine(37)-N1)-methyltransferase TrmD [Lachnospiraceae bacterium]|nr:tRNA (guanosine(37)-N1)-methyltransferase TrmD [Lachnospiraceae bacterium]